ncbi:MAG: Na(+)/H(+) antiporter NhaA, partial [Chitinophagaceae bacterium]
FALANTALYIAPGWMEGLGTDIGLGIITGLVVGKPVGILLFTGIAVALGVCTLPAGLTWKHIAGTGLLAGIGFTMSIFVTLLAFTDASQINIAKISIITASVIAASTGLLVLALILKKKSVEAQTPTV